MNYILLYHLQYIFSILPLSNGNSFFLNTKSKNGANILAIYMEIHGNY